MDTLLLWLVLIGGIGVVWLAAAYRRLAAQHQALARQHEHLQANWQQLKLLHNLMLFWQGASDSKLVLQQLLKVVHEELGVSQVVVGLVNPTRQRIEGWQFTPALPVVIPPLVLGDERGLLVRAVETQQTYQAAEGETIVAAAHFPLWFTQEPWLILPIVWQTQTVGVLLAGSPVPPETRALLQILTQHCALAFGTIAQTRQLAIEEERNRIARDIHDTVAQSLFGLNFSLDACRKLLPHQAELVQEELGELSQLVSQVRDQVRQSILDIWPSNLTRTQFQADLEEYVSQYALAHGFGLEFTVEGDFDGLPALTRRTLYRVCQEALANAARHSGAPLARVTLWVEPEEVQLSIRDKGIGFHVKPTLARVQDRERFGLRGIRERVEAVGGSCDIMSEIGQGTQVLVRIPTGQGDRVTG